MKKVGEWAFYLVIAAGVLAGGFVAWKMLYHPSARPGTVDAVHPSMPASLEGNYSMKIVSAGETHYSTAVVRELVERQYRVTRITVYGPAVYGFTLEGEDTVTSMELGNGTVSYWADLEKTTIRFEREDFVCELTR